MGTNYYISDLDDVIWDRSTNILTNTAKCDKTEFGLGYDLFKRMQENKEKVAQYIHDTHEADTYGSFLKRAIRTAIELKKRNLGKDDVVCICSHNNLNNCMPLVACFFLGIPVTFLDPTFNVNDATPLINLVKPKVFFIVPEFINVVTECCKNVGLDSEIVVFNEDGDKTRFTPFSDFLKQHESENEFKPVVIKDVSQTAAIFFSSGTTGTSKGVCCSHKTIYNNAYLINSNSSIQENPVFLVYSAFYWISATLLLVSCTLLAGARVICKKFDPELFWPIIEKYKVSWSFLSPANIGIIVSYGTPKHTNISSLKMILTGGTHISVEMLNALRKLVPNILVFQGYGLTEFGGVATAFNLAKTKDRLLMQNRPGSCGRPLAGAEYQVINTDKGNSCGPNEKGELRIRSEFISNGYYNQNSISAVDEEGWLRTGDVLYYDQDYCFYFVGRIKEMLKYRSWQISPTTLEEILFTHPSVKQCVVVGIPHPIDGDLPLAAIVLHDSYIGKVAKEDIEKYVADRVHDSHKLRGGVKFIAKMPTTPSEKVKKQAIRKMILEELI